MAFKLVVTGPESVGKSTLVKQLAEFYKCLYVPEYARTYVECLNRPYTFNDVELIARKQIDEYDLLAQEKGIVFFDTFLEITKVWFEYVYTCLPDWFNFEYEKRTIDLYLLCKPDLPWVKDEVRENEALREELFLRYQQELEDRNCNYVIIEGNGHSRMNNAINALKKYNL